MKRLPDFSQMDQAEQANWMHFNPDYVDVIEIRVQYDFSEKRWEDILPHMQAVIGLTEQDRAAKAEQVARMVLAGSTRHAKQVRWNWYNNLQGHYILAG